MKDKTDFTCADCGWKLDWHGKAAMVGSNPPSPDVAKGGYSYTLRACPGYRKSLAERRATCGLGQAISGRLAGTT